MLGSVVLTSAAAAAGHAVAAKAVVRPVNHGVIGSGTRGYGVIGSGGYGVIGSGSYGVIGSGGYGVIGSGSYGVIGSGGHKQK